MTTEIFRTVAGSRLFGTNTLQSDTDYKAVHIPAPRSILLGTADAVIDQSTGTDATANSAEDVDMVSFPLCRFLRNLAKMETNSLEILFAPNEHDDAIWDMIKDDRFKVMSSNKKAFTGYAKGQAMRYAVRGDRIECLEKLVNVLECLDPNERMCDQFYIRTELDKVDNVKVIHKPEGHGPTPYITAFGRECPLTCKPSEALKVYRKPLLEAGKRTRNAVETGGPDWKGLYHALRIVDEGIELFSTGELIFPCDGAGYYLDIRSGDASLERVLDRFEARLIELEELKPISDFAEEPDREWINELIFSVYEQAVIGSYEKWRAAV